MWFKSKPSKKYGSRLAAPVSLVKSEGESSASNASVQAEESHRFSSDDLCLIRMMPRATVGGGMILPSGLKTTNEIIKLTDDFPQNVCLLWDIIDKSAIES